MPKTLLEKPEPFSYEDFIALPGEQRVAIRQMLALKEGPAMDNADDSECVKDVFGNDDPFALLKTCEGCVPDGYEGDDLLNAIHTKFWMIPGAALELVESELKDNRRLRAWDDFGFFTVIDPAHDGATHVAVIDSRFEERPYTYYHFYTKAWHYNFMDLAAVAGPVLDVRRCILENYDKLVRKGK